MVLKHKNLLIGGILSVFPILYFLNLTLNTNKHIQSYKYVSSCLDHSEYYIEVQNYTYAKNYLDSAALYIERINDPSLSALYYQLLGDYYNYKREELKAHNSYYKAIELYEKAGIKYQQSTIYNNIAFSYLQKQDTSALKKILEQMAPICSKQIDKIILYNLTAHYYNGLYKKNNKQLELLDSIILYEKKAIFTFENLSEQQKSEFNISHNYIMLTDNLIKKENYNLDTVTYYLEKAKQWANPLDTSMIVNCYWVEGEIAFKSKKLYEAKDIFEKQLTLINNWSNKGNLSIYSYIYDRLSQISESQKDYAAAMEYERKKIACLNEIHDAEKYRTITELNAKYESDKKDQKIAYQNNVKWLYLGICLLSFVSFFFIFRWMLSRKKAADSRLQIMQMEKNEIELQKQLQEEQLKKVELEKYEVLLDNHFKGLKISEMDEAMFFLQNEQQNLIIQIHEFSERVNHYEQSKQNEPGTNIKDPYFSKLVHEIYNAINKRLDTAEERHDYIEALRSVNDNFFLNLKKEYRGKDLSVINIKYCISFATGMDNHHVAECLCVEHRSVHMARHRLRKNFNIDDKMDFNLFLKQLI